MHAVLTWRRCAAASCALVSFVGWACASEAGPAGEPVRTDSAGVTIVENAGADRILDWTFERTLDLGGTDEGPTAFFRVFPTSIGVDSLGNLYVLDAGNYRISVFDRAGRHLRSFGRQGEGPGELGFPSDMAVTPAGAVAVYDFDRRALVLFAADGSFMGSFTLPGSFQRRVALLDDGGIAASVMQPSSAPDSSDDRLLVLGGDTVELARVRRISAFSPRHFSCTSVALPPYFAPRVVWAAAGNRVAFSEDAAYSVGIVDGSRLVAIWRRPVPVIRSTLELAAWEVRSGDSLRVRGCVVPAREAAEKIGYADVAPIIRGLAVAPDGRVWLLRRTDVPGDLPIDLFDATGAYVGTLPDGAPFPALFRGTDEIITVETDEFDRPHVVVYRIHRG